MPDIVLSFWPDADLHGDEFHTKSTSGCWVELAWRDDERFLWRGSPRNNTAQLVRPLKPNTVSMAVGARGRAIPLQGLLELALDRPVEGVFW